MKTGRAALVFEEQDLRIIKWALDQALRGVGLVDHEKDGLKRIGNRVAVAIKRAKA